MADKKIIAITGATGAQGGGLARAVLGDPGSGFAVRALTRKPDSDKARQLAALGAEVVAADIDDAESVRRAFAGAHAAFCVTNFWEHFSPERETAQAKHLATAAHHAGVGHVVWSTFEDTRHYVPLADTRMPTLQGKYKVPHFDAKAEANHYFSDLGLPTTFLLTSFYWENFILFGMGPKRGPDGVLAITMPLGDKKMPSLSAEDIGKFAYGLFKSPSEFAGKTVGVAAEHLTGAQMAGAMSKAFGQEVRYNAVPAEVYRGFGFPGADDLGNMFQFKADFEDVYCAHRDLGLVRRLNPTVVSFDQWLAANKGRIPIE